jgi:glycerol transport system ATP-binding protein
MARITLDGVAHAYIGPHGPGAQALHRLDHSWEQGCAYALLGPSGCGETTLLNLISGLVTPSEGRILFDGRDVTRLPTEQRNIAQVFQFPVIYDTMTVTQTLAFPLKNQGVPRDAINARVAEIADLLGLNAYLQRQARGLSADVKQKISLRRGLVRADVAAVLFDEPLTVIDPSLKWELRTKLKAVHRALDLLMIYVTHDQVEALSFADEVVVMKEGRVLQIATPLQLFEQPQHTYVGYFIGSPGMNLLPAQVTGSTANVDGQTITLPAHYKTPAPGSTVKLGFRPDYASVVRNGGLAVRVQKIEDLGRRRLARLKLGSHEIYATVPREVSIDGDVAGLMIEPSRLFVYVNDERVQGEPA